MVRGGDPCPGRRKLIDGGGNDREGYVAGDTRSFARDIGLEPTTTPIEVH